MSSAIDDEMNLTATPGCSDAPCLSATYRGIFIAWFTVSLLFLPLFLLVLYIGFNKWRSPRSSASGGLSHSDVITLHMVLLEMINIVSSAVYLSGFYGAMESLMPAVVQVVTLTFTGHVLFHCLTCVERYLAVVHPVTYMRLRGGGGVTVRNISIAFVWGFGLCFSAFLCHLKSQIIYILTLTILIMPLITCCSVSVLCALTRPKPGGVSGKQTDQSKRATIYTMMSILGVFFMTFFVLVITNSLMHFHSRTVDVCLVEVASKWFYFPSSLLLPLLFLHRAGRLTNRG